MEEYGKLLDPFRLRFGMLDTNQKGLPEMD